MSKSTHVQRQTDEGTIMAKLGINVNISHKELQTMYELQSPGA